MPNYVYSTISVEEQYEPKLKEIIEAGGLCRYYKPEPLELTETTAPVRITETVTQEVIDKRIKDYGHADWYSWRGEHWGTKWGDVSHEYDEGQVNFESAWSPISFDLIEMLMEDIPSFSYFWEEEQGYGAEYEVVDGSVLSHSSYDVPNWEETDNDEVYYLNEDDYQMSGMKFKRGYYANEMLTEFLGDTLEDAIKKL